MNKENYHWSEWFERNPDDSEKPLLLLGVSREDFEFKTKLGASPGHTCKLNWNARGKPYRITHYRYKIYDDEEDPTKFFAGYSEGDLSKEEIMGEQALRYNDNKPELSYILEADYAVEGVCEVLAFGAKKYDRSNYKKGFPKEKLADSLLRHLSKYLNGQELDEESGLHHLDHVLANSIFLSYHYNGKKDGKTTT